jgi:DNA-binding NarL/FixJ family response regulator
MASDEMLRAFTAPSQLRVAVASDQHLVAESVRAALHNRGHDTVGIRWPVVDESAHGVVSNTLRLRRRNARPAGSPPDVAVLLSDLNRFKQVRGAQLLLGALDVPWLVLSGAPRGPVWGALYDSGASLVVRTDTGLDELCGLLDDLHEGRAAHAAVRPDLVLSWRHFARQQGELNDRIRTLTGREEQVLQQLYEGLGVRSIAERGAVTEATVRSQVKAILRKLEVNSQLAAVAAYQQVLGQSPHQTALAVVSGEAEPARDAHIG